MRVIRNVKERMDNLESELDNHDLTDHGLGLIKVLFWYTIFLIGISLIFYYAFIPLLQPSPKPSAFSPYYEDRYTFCEHFSMTYDAGTISERIGCLEFVNDTIINRHEITSKNGRYYFLDGIER